MKSVCTAFVLAATLFAGPLAQAAAPSFVAQLTKIDLDSQLKLGDIASASVAVDTFQKKITLSIQPAMPECPAGMACAQVMPDAKVIEAPLKSVQQSDCGDTYVAEIDQRPMDGVMKRITVKDYSTSTCEIVITNLVQVTYEMAYYDRLGGKSVTTTSRLAGDIRAE